MPKERIQSDRATRSELPDLFRHGLQIGRRHGRPDEIVSLAMQRRRALGKALLQVVEFIPPLQSMDEHLACLASDALRLNPAIERLTVEQGGPG